MQTACYNAFDGEVYTGEYDATKLNNGIIEVLKNGGFSADFDVIAKF